MEASILPFLPGLLRSDSGSLQWPQDLNYAFKSVMGGPPSCSLLGPEPLFDFINDLRHQTHLPALHSSVLDGMATYFNERIAPDQARSFFESVLPAMANLAFRFPALLNDHFRQLDCGSSKVETVTLRVLEPQKPGLVFLSQELVAAILACAFFCIFPVDARAEFKLPFFGFQVLFQYIYSQQEQKLQCLIHYFTRVSKEMPQGMVSFERKVLSRQGEQSEMYPSMAEPDKEYWISSSSSFCPLKVLESGTIEDQSSDALEVDFANEFLGGGVLGHGCVQEEIRFVINPELLAGMLFMPAMQSNEAIEIRGAERFSCYTGYGSTFRFSGDYIDNKSRDLRGRRKSYIVAIDALPRPGQLQYKEKLMLREVNKAFCGFLDHLDVHFTECIIHPTKKEFSSSEFCPGINSANLDETWDLTSDVAQNTSGQCTKGIATGNWGCGAFGGDVELKSLLQWMAASQAGRSFLHYFTFGSSTGPKLQQVADEILNEKWAVGNLWSLLVDFGEKKLQGVYRGGLFDWLLSHLSSQHDTRGSDGLLTAKH